MHKGTYRLFIIGTLCMLLTVGTIFGYRSGKNIALSEKVDISYEKTNIDENIPVVSNDFEINTISKNKEFKITKQIKYTDCNHISISEDIIIADSIDAALKDVASGFDIKNKSENSAILEKVNEGFCSEHYLVSLDEDEVIVYKRLSLKEKEIYNETNIPITILREDTLDDLKAGIEVESLEDLNKIIEELES